MPSNMELPDPFPSKRPIIPVDEEDEDDPVTSEVQAIRDTDPLEAMKLARQKIRASSQKMERVSQKLTPSGGQRMTDPKKTD